MVRPKHECQNPFPEREMEEPDGKHPGNDPQTTRNRMMLNFYFVHADKYINPYEKSAFRRFSYAERERFELSVQFPIRRISSAVPSTTQPPLQVLRTIEEAEWSNKFVLLLTVG